MEQMLPMDRLQVSPLNPRKNMDPGYISELAQSLQVHGQLDAILVRPIDNGRWEIIAGHCRVQAARSAGWTEIRAHAKPMNDEQADCLALETNLARRSLNPLEEAEGIQVMMTRHGWTQAMVAQRFSRTQAWVSNALNLLTLTPEVKDQVITQVINPTQAREIARAPTEMQPALAARVADANLSKDATQQLVHLVTNPETPADVKEAALHRPQVTPAHAAAIAKAQNPVLRQGLIESAVAGRLTAEQAEHEVEVATRREQAPTSITSAHVQRRLDVFPHLTKAAEALESIEAEAVFRLAGEDERGNPFVDPVLAARESIGRITSLASRIAMWLDAAENRQLAPQQGGSGKVLRFPGAGGTAS